MKNTFHAVKVDAVPGITLMRLTHPWRHHDGTLPAGTVVTPISCGHDRTTGAVTRVVSIGRKIVTGPY
jgi:hypothetical protein